MPIAPSRLPAPAVSWLVDSSPFSVQVGVGPDSVLGCLGSSVSSCLISSCLRLRLRYKVVEVSFRRRIVIVATSGGYFGTRSDKSSREINAQPPPEGETEDRVDSCAAASYATSCSDVNNQASKARHGRSRHKLTLTMAHRLDLTRRSIRIVVSSEA